MTRRSIFVVCALALLTVGIACAQSGYLIGLAKPAMAGSHQLKPGEYGVKVKGPAEVIITGQDGKSYSIPVKTEQSATKYKGTSAEIGNVGGKDTIIAIDLGGSNTRLVLNQ
jgi:hypothetical protein